MHKFSKIVTKFWIRIKRADRSHTDTKKENTAKKIIIPFLHLVSKIINWIHTGYQKKPSGPVVEEKSIPTPQEFNKKYVNARTPVVLRQAVSNVPAMTLWTGWSPHRKVCVTMYMYIVFTLKKDLSFAVVVVVVVCLATLVIDNYTFTIVGITANFSQQFKMF